MTEHHDTSPHDPVRVSDDPAEVAKVHEMISGMDIAMLTTVDSSSSEGRLTSRPLSTQVAEDDGDVLFLVRSSSAAAADVRADPRVNVAYSSMKAWVSLAGTASLVEDRALVEQLWSKGADLFMEGGSDNPDNVVLRVSADTAHYWGGDSLLGTAVSTLRAVTGRDSDEPSSTVVELP
ncbi:pyridoxamine 5'-phosphate oxidase family protein [Ornithinimicrobium cryptoxanthini]|uniref:Pyridoxamine 5'-phosphate oxidase family protein n=1 Tax=Ornithinimicrobium cryptoxanthini TaxID=2934161 RepID=A0ABY4YDY3_9MICO|nr:pyridoxamine 5'-phosphate oxidase family protein [Ornithinimicrobium cryptoxanthini]USQ74760.1 pyridoxamine 5'-phosphate oxidase family protein [Ornithinimicrobium cryptoxanthini]